MKVIDVAKICHDVNRAYCISIGDNSQESWDNAPEWQKQSVLEGVKIIFNNELYTPEQLHENWMTMKLNNGWKYGAIKDVWEKEHPCLVPFYQLPHEQKIKDYLFISVVNSLREYIEE